jgi:hypothetical protein
MLIVLAAFLGLRQGELLELRRSDVDGFTGRIKVGRKLNKDVIAGVVGACPDCFASSVHRRRRAVSGPSTFRRRSCQCSSTCSSTRPPAHPACCSPATAPVT